MLRIVGAAMIIFAGSMIGFLKADSLKKRVELLGKLITGLNLLETDISYGQKNLKSALYDIGEHQKIDFFKKIAKEIDKKGIKEALASAIARDGEYLLARDKAPIMALGENLGMTDCDSQIISIKRASAGLCEGKTDAEAEYARLGKLYRSTGVLCGILGAIILI